MSCVDNVIRWKADGPYRSSATSALTTDGYTSVIIVDSGNIVTFIYNKISCYYGKLRLNYNAVDIKI